MFFFAIILIIMTYLFITWRNRANYWKKRNVVAGQGVFLKFLRGDRSFPEYIKELYDAHDTNVGIFFPIEPALVLKDLEDIQAVFAGEFQSFYSRGIIMNPNDLLADNILFIENYKRWKCIRQKLSPVFTSSKLKNMFFILNKCGKDFVDLMDVDGQMRDEPFNALYTYTTASITASIFGIETKQTKSTMDSPFLAMAWQSVEPSLKTNFKIFINGLSPKLFNLMNLKLFGEHEQFFIGFVRSVLEMRRKNTEKRHDFIEVCLELQKEGFMKDSHTGYEIEASVEVLAAQAFFFFIAGVETSANSMHFLLLQLAGHQDILAKIHKEIDSVFQNSGEDLTYSDIEKFKYLDMALSEAMRMYPSIGSLQRKCTQDTVLPGSKVKVEKGVIVVISTYGIHRDAKFYPNPDVFDPDRFAPDNLSKIKNYSYLPFGEGNRICIGNRFARLQMLAGLAWLLRRFTLAEKKYEPKRFERSGFSIRDTKARYDLIRRDI